MAFSVRSAVTFSQLQQRSTAPARLHEASRGFGQQRGHVGHAAHRKALRAQVGMPNITAYARSVHHGISQLARRSTALPSPLVSARCRIVLATQ